MSVRQTKYASQGPHGPHNIFYKEWGDENNANVLFCSHGLTRNSGDFDYFCSKMEDTYRIACPDMPGRGQSDWLAKENYQFPLYISAASSLITRLGVAKLDWLGTSMGGVLGMFMAAQPNTPIRKLVLNDVGPFASRESQLNIAKYAGNDERFDTFEEVIAYFKNIYASWGNVSDDHWNNVARQSSCKRDNGTYSLAYDPAIIAPLKENLDAITDINMWPIFEAIQIPILLIHGVESTVLTTELAQEMKLRNKNLELFDCPGTGHAPSLMEDYQVKVIRDWLLK